MNIAEQKERALTFLRSLETADGTAIDKIIADDFEMEMMARMPGVAPIRGKETFLKQMLGMLKAAFPKGFNMKFGTVIAEGPHVAIQAESDTVAANGRKYQNRYHFYFRFEGDRIAQVREYNDSNHVREVLFT